MGENGKLHVIMLRTAGVLLSLVLLTSSIVSGRFARYVTSAESSANARVAKFVVTQSISSKKTGQTQTIPMPEIKPGETVTIDIVVEHDIETTVCNTIEINSMYDNLPLTFRIQEAGTTDTAEVPFTAVYGPGTYTKNYTANITWTPGSNDLEYIGMVDLLIITVTSEQVD